MGAGGGGRGTSRQEQFQAWVCCVCGFCWALVWHLQGFIEFQAPAFQMAEESSQALWQMCPNSKFLEKALIIPLFCLSGLASKGSWSTGQLFLLQQL